LLSPLSTMCAGWFLVDLGFSFSCSPLGLLKCPVLTLLTHSPLPLPFVVTFLPLLVPPPLRPPRRRLPILPVPPDFKSFDPRSLSSPQLSGVPVYPQIPKPHQPWSSQSAEPFSFIGILKVINSFSVLPPPDGISLPSRRICHHRRATSKNEKLLCPPLTIVLPYVGVLAGSGLTSVSLNGV